MTFRFFKSLAMLAGALLCVQPLSAAWYEASSDNFVIYADDSERDIVRFAENLERFHSAMAFVTRREVEKPTPSNRVVIFVVGSQRDVRDVFGTRSRTLAGFYIPRAGASRAFVQDIRNTRGELDFSTIVLLHEYAHHYMISSSRFPMPRWMSEGGAEFFASARFGRDGSVAIGRPAQHRAYELFNSEYVPIRELLDEELYQENRGRGYDAFYGRSWLLYHYLVFNTERSGQLHNYWLEILKGTAPIEAGERVFGDLDELDQELRRYLRQRRMLSFNLSADQLQSSDVTMRRLPEGEAAMMDVRIRSQRGVDAEQAAELVVEAREIAAEYPNDPGALTALAEAEFDAGNDDAAIAAADAAIALDPSRTNAYLQKGYALFRKAEDADDLASAYNAAMAPFSQLNRIETGHPLPLIYFYRSFVERGAEPSETARLALEQAALAAPFDQRLWMQVGILQASEGKIDLAKLSLSPLAANPHESGLSRAAQSYMTVLNNSPEGTPVDLSQVMILPTVEAVGDDEEEGHAH